MADLYDEEDDSGQWVNVHTPYGAVQMTPKRARRYEEEANAAYDARQAPVPPAAPDDSGQWTGVTIPGAGKVYMTPERANRYADQVDADYEAQRAEDDALAELAGAMDYAGIGKPPSVPVPTKGAGNRRPAPRTNAQSDVDALGAAWDDFYGRAQQVDVENVPSAVQLASRMGGQPLPGPTQKTAVASPAPGPEQGTAFEPDELRGAQSRAALMRGLAGAGRGMSRVGAAIAGVRPEAGEAGAMERGADSQVRDYLQRKQQSEAEKAAAEQSALKDPTSPASQRFQAMVSRAFGSVYTPEQIAQMTAADAPLVGKYGEMVRTLEDRAAARTAEQEGQQAQLDARATEAEKQRAFEGEQNAANRANALKIAGMRQDGAGAAKINPVPAGEAADLGEATSALTAADKVFEQYKAKAGGISGAVGSFIPGTEAIQYDNDDRRAAAQVIGRFLEGGKLAAGDEVKYMNLMPAAGDSEARAQNKIDNLKRLIGERQKERIAGLKAAGYKTGDLGTQPHRVGMQGNMDLEADTVTIIPPPAPDGTPRPPKQVPRGEAQRYLSAGATLANG